MSITTTSTSVRLGSITFRVYFDVTSTELDHLNTEDCFEVDGFPRFWCDGMTAEDLVQAGLTEDNPELVEAIEEACQQIIDEDEAYGVGEADLRDDHPDSLYW